MKYVEAVAVRSVIEPVGSPFGQRRSTKLGFWLARHSIWSVGIPNPKADPPIDLTGL